MIKNPAFLLCRCYCMLVAFLLRTSINTNTNTNTIYSYAMKTVSSRILQSRSCNSKMSTMCIVTMTSKSSDETSVSRRRLKENRSDTLSTPKSQRSSTPWVRSTRDEPSTKKFIFKSFQRSSVSSSRKIDNDDNVNNYNKIDKSKNDDDDNLSKELGFPTIRKPSLVVTNSMSTKRKSEKINKRDNDDETSETVVSNPWKQLIKKLETEPITAGTLTKVKNNLTLDYTSTVDELQCKHFDSCGGCTVKGNFTNIPVVTRAKLFFQSENIIIPIRIYDHWAWRTHVKLAVRPLSKWGGLKFGLYKPGTHEVEPIPDCRVHHPRINEAVEVLKAEASALGVKAYEHATDRSPEKGELRYIQLSLERSTGRVHLVLVWNSLGYKEAEQTLPRLVKKLKSRFDLFNSITVNFQASKGNAIFNFHPKAWKLLWGAPVLREQIHTASFFFRPQIFRQANLDAFEKGIIPAVIKQVPTGSKVSELYSGIGVIGLNVASKAEVVYCSDSNEFVDDVFDKCCESLPEADRNKVFYENLPAEEAVEAGQCDEADVIIVDPPRRGLDEGVLRLLLDKHESRNAMDLKRLIYVSCGYDALEKDCRTLIESGLWRLKSAEGYILFPGSDHLESVVVFDRIGRRWSKEVD